jgi:cell division protein 48 (CDC48)-like
MSDMYSPLSLKVLEAYSTDVGRGVARIDQNSLNLLSLSEGDSVEIIGKDKTVEAKCLVLLPYDEGGGIIRVDPHISKSIGVSVGETINIRTIKVDSEKNRNHSSTKEDDLGKTPAKRYNETVSMIIISGSCIDFEKERVKIMGFIGSLELGTHMKSQCQCYTDGKKTLGWDFFEISVASDFVDKLRNLYPDIDKQEGNLFEQRFVLWLDKHMKKKKLEYHLKLREIPFESSKGFRLNPKNYRDDSEFEELR